MNVRVTVFPSESDLNSPTGTLLAFSGWALDDGEEVGWRLFVQRFSIRLLDGRVEVAGNAYVHTGPSEYKKVGFLRGSYFPSGGAGFAHFSLERGA